MSAGENAREGVPPPRKRKEWYSLGKQAKGVLLPREYMYRYGRLVQSRSAAPALRVGNRPAAAENAANFFRSSTRATGGFQGLKQTGYVEGKNLAIAIPTTTEMNRAASR